MGKEMPWKYGVDSVDFPRNVFILFKISTISFIQTCLKIVYLIFFLTSFSSGKNNSEVFFVCLFLWLFFVFFVGGWLFCCGCWLVCLFVFPNLLFEYGSTLHIFPFIVSPVPAFRQLPLFVWVSGSLIL